MSRTLTDLVDAAKAGDRDAFEELARAWVTRMHSTAFLVLRDADVALEDVDVADAGPLAERLHQPEDVR